jgi:aminodeoxyfutalosine deaminase
VDALIGFGLGGPEVGVPRPQFQPHFDAARAAGLRSVPHAGETTGPETVWHALQLLGAERIGHGTTAVEDPALLAHLAETGIPLEVCPSSNIATRAVAAIEEHPIVAFRDAGVTVTVNSDDPPMFGTSLNREYEIAADLLGLDEAGVAELARTAVRASFAEEPMKATLLAEIDAYV